MFLLTLCAKTCAVVLQQIKKALNFKYLNSNIQRFCDPAEARTQDPQIKSLLLYQLSYEVIR